MNLMETVRPDDKGSSSKITLVRRGDPGQAARLKEARRAAGIRLTIDAAHAMGLSNSTVYWHEAAYRRIAPHHFPRYARLYGVSAHWLETGQGTPRTLRLKGYIGPQGLVLAGIRMADDTVDPPDPNLELTPYRVLGDHNWPALADGDVVYTRAPCPPDQLAGRLVIARLADGSECLGTLQRASGKGWLLLRTNAPAVEARITSAAPVAWIRK